MKLAVISDTHDNIWTLERAIPHLQAADAVIHCGDLCAPFMAERLGKGVPGVPLHFVWGNNEGDTFFIHKVSQRFSNITLHGPFAEIEFEGLSVAVNHYPEIARGLAHSGLYGLVCYGHDHTAHVERIGDCTLLNPGELMGMNAEPTLALVDTESMEVRSIAV